MKCFECDSLSVCRYKQTLEDMNRLLTQATKVKEFNEYQEWLYGFASFCRYFKPRTSTQTARNPK